LYEKAVMIFHEKIFGWLGAGFRFRVSSFRIQVAGYKFQDTGCRIVISE
jgi:hypothetical protein